MAYRVLRRIGTRVARGRCDSFREVEGGLNQMTIGRIERILEASELGSAAFELVPIRKLRRLHNRLTRECLTSVVRCRLVPKRSVRLGAPVAEVRDLTK